MEQKALATVKDRAEGRPVSPYTPVVEIKDWLAVLAMGLAAGVHMLARLAWKRPLAVGAAAVIVLLVLTFLSPPLWLRVESDLGLLGGLVWAFRKQPIY